MNDNKENLFLELPIIPLRGIVVFPKMVLHFDVGRRKSVKALQKQWMTTKEFSCMPKGCIGGRA